jgi:hypothetical protein
MGKKFHHPNILIKYCIHILSDGLKLKPSLSRKNPDFWNEIQTLRITRICNILINSETLEEKKLQNAIYDQYKKSKINSHITL